MTGSAKQLSTLVEYKTIQQQMKTHQLFAGSEWWAQTPDDYYSFLKSFPHGTYRQLALVDDITGIPTAVMGVMITRYETENYYYILDMIVNSDSEADGDDMVSRRHCLMTEVCKYAKARNIKRLWPPRQQQKQYLTLHYHQQLRRRRRRHLNEWFNLKSKSKSKLDSWIPLAKL